MKTTTTDELIERHAVLLLDAYGVLVGTAGALPGARELIARLNRAQKPYYILTNDASKLPETASRRYHGFGLDIEPGRIVSAGTLLPACLAGRGLKGSRCAVLGTEDSLRFVERAGGVPVPIGEDFETLVLCDENGFPFLDGIDRTLSTLYARLDRGDGVHLILPNPDLVFLKSAGDFGIAAGTMALMFESALALRYPDRPGLEFIRLGKPHATIFEEVLRRSGTRDMVMIGDQLATDIRGAREFGLPAALLAGGISTEVPADLSEALRPNYLLESLG
ncbi:MAG: HAD-IA family hydrolase [Gammaproteobacteria bacterium]|nr:HAD-IA family hydrolase [Gammaproteobacteria bacterium]